MRNAGAGGAARRRTGAARRCGAAVAGLRQPRHVKQLCASRRGVRGRSQGNRLGARRGARMRFAMPFLSSAPAAKPMKEFTQRSKMMEYDQPLVWVTVLLMLFGIVMVYSASISLPDSPKYAAYKNWHFLVRQARFIGVSMLAGLLTFRVRVQTWQKWAPYLFVITLFLLMMVLVPGIGKGVNGAKRWLPFKIFNLQPSELMKMFMVLYAADYTVRKQQYMHQLTKGFMPMTVAVGVVGLLLLLEPDLGAFGVIVCNALGIVWRRPWRQRGKAALPAGGAHRFSAGRDR